MSKYLKELDMRFEPEDNWRTQHEVGLVLHGARVKKLPRPSSGREGSGMVVVPVKVLQGKGVREASTSSLNTRYR